MILGRRLGGPTFSESSSVSCIGGPFLLRITRRRWRWRCSLVVDTAASAGVLAVLLGVSTLVCEGDPELLFLLVLGSLFLPLVDWRDSYSSIDRTGERIRSFIRGFATFGHTSHSKCDPAGASPIHCAAGCITLATSHNGSGTSTESSVWSSLGGGVMGADSEPLDDDSRSGPRNDIGGLLRLKRTTCLCLCLSIAPAREGESSFFKSTLSA